VPKAEVNLSILNVDFRDVGYQGVTESEAAYIDRGGPTHSSYAARNHFTHIYYLNLGLDNSTGTKNPRVQL